VAGVHNVVAEIKEIAAGYRDQGKRYFLQIEAVLVDDKQRFGTPAKNLRENRGRDIDLVILISAP